MVAKMATPTSIRAGARMVKPILSLDRTEARRRVYNLYKLCYRHIPFISMYVHFRNFCSKRQSMLEFDACVIDRLRLSLKADRTTAQSGVLTVRSVVRPCGRSTIITTAER